MAGKLFRLKPAVLGLVALLGSVGVAGQVGVPHSRALWQTANGAGPVATATCGTRRSIRSTPRTSRT